MRVSVNLKLELRVEACLRKVRQNTGVVSGVAAPFTHATRHTSIVNAATYNGYAKGSRQ